MNDRTRENGMIAMSYVVFALCSMVVVQHFSDLDSSLSLTAGSGLQCFAFYLLLQKTRVQRSVAGISSKMLEMYVLAFFFRLNATLFREGYLPVDKSGDFVYQSADVASLLILLQLIYCVQKRNKATYQAEFDTLPIWRALPGCIALGVVLRGSLNHSLYYDTMWCTAMNIDTIAMLPQLWMLVRKGGEVEALTSNYIASIFFSRLCVLSFWWQGYVEINSKPDVPSVLSGYWVVAAHSIQVLLSLDFMYHYCCAKAEVASTCCGGLASGGKVVLPVSGNIDI